MSWADRIEDIEQRWWDGLTWRLETDACVVSYAIVLKSLETAGLLRGRRLQ